ncbi:Glycine-rich protein / oleosin [Hirschfeldia incana]|nr:Glycine-rich protein / oleosin [Hirschfeldia incana]
MENHEGRRRDISRIDGEKTTGSSAVLATVAAVAVAGPLVGLMSFSLVATVTLFLIVSPLILIFSPVLMAAVAILLVAVVGVGVDAVMWVLGIAALVCCGREIGVRTGVAERMVESVVRELGYGRSRYLRNK